MVSWARAFQIRQHLKGSLWVLPLLGCIAGVVIAQLAVALDSVVQLPAGWHYSPSTASTVLAAIVGAMIGLLGFVVTVSVLVVQQATGSLSPRYMRLWYRDRMQKVVLALFAGTCTYAFALLRRIQDNFVPDIGISLAGLAIGVSLVSLLVYVNRFTHRLRPVAVASAVSQWGHRVLEEWARKLGANTPATTPDSPDVLPEGEPVLQVTAARAGAIQAFSAEGLLRLAVHRDCTLVLCCSVGDFVAAGTPLVDVFGAAAPDEQELRNLIALGVERTIEQDPAFALRILVDVAIRALSPAVNDPTTAVQVLDYIEEFLETIGRFELRTRYAITDEKGHVRLIVPGRSWDAIVQLAFTEIIAYGARSVQVCRRLRAAMDALAEAVPAPHQPAVQAQLEHLDQAVARNFPDAAERLFAGVSDRQGIGGRSAEGRSLEADVPPARTQLQARLEGSIWSSAQDVPR